MKGYGIRSRVRGRWGTAAGSRHCNIGHGKGRLSHGKASWRTQETNSLQGKQKKAIQERGPVGCFPSPGMQLESDCFGGIQCRSRNLKRQCIPDGPQVAVQTLIVTSAENVSSVVNVQERWTTYCC
jgi:hypothetical protein